MAQFKEGKEFELLNTIGIKYGYIIVESHEPMFVIDLEIGESIINFGVTKGILTDTDVKEIEAQMGEIDLCENMMGVFEKIREFTIPDDTPTQSYFFRKCERQTCNPSVVHGNIFLEDTGAVVNNQVLVTLSMGYAFCFINMQENNISSLNVIIMLKQMLETGMTTYQNDLMPSQETDDKLQN